MRNIQVIDAAENCSFSIYTVNEVDFSSIFPNQGQDIEFVEDLVERIGEHSAGEIVMRATRQRVEKASVKGIHGTLFFGLSERKKFYPYKRESDLDKPGKITGDGEIKGDGSQ